MRYPLILAALLWLPSMTFSQVELGGIVTSTEDNQPLTGAVVQLKNTYFAKSTDAEGKFLFSNVKKGTYPIEVSFLGYNTFTDTLKVDADNGSLNFQLTPQTLWTEEVVIKAQRASDITPTTYQNIEKEAIEKNNLGQDLPYLLNWTPSIVTTSDAGNGVGYTGLRIRGTDQTRINVTINGIPYNDSESQGVFWVNIPDISTSTQSIQIQRGVGTSTNGAAAFGGSVNLQTLGANQEAYGRFSGSYGSFNTFKLSAEAGTGLVDGKWSFDGRVSRIGSDGYVDRASSDLSSYYLAAGYYGKNTVIKLIGFGGRERTYQSWFGIDSTTLADNRTFNPAGQVFNSDGSTRFFYDDQVDNYAQDHLQLHVSQKLGTNWTVNGALHFTYGRGYFEEYQDVNNLFAETSLSHYKLPNIVFSDTTITNTDLIRRRWLDNDFYGFTGSAVYSSGRLEFIYGLSANRYDGDHFGEVLWARWASTSEKADRYYESNSVKDDFTTYAKATYRFSPKLSGFLDLQYRRVDYTAKGEDNGMTPIDINEDFNFFNPKLGLAYSFTNNDEIYASFSVANREPNRVDFIESEDPKPERLNDFELGYKRTSQRYAFEIVGYYMRYQDQLVLSGRLDDVGAPIRENVDNSYRAGLEIAGAVLLAKGLTWSPNLTLSQNQIVDNRFTNSSGEEVVENATIAFSPSVIFGSELSYRFLNNFEVALLSKYVGEQFMTNTNNDRSKLDAYFVNDLRFVYQPKIRSLKDFKITALINNIADVEYASNGYFFGAPYYYPQAGRNYLAGIVVGF